MPDARVIATFQVDDESLVLPVRIALKVRWDRPTAPL